MKPILPLQIIPNNLLNEYLKYFPDNARKVFNELIPSNQFNIDFNFYTSVASVFSSKIEGENIDLDSYIKHKHYSVPFHPDYTKKIDDLYNAYLFAQNNSLSSDNIKKAHHLLSQHLLQKQWQGQFRKQIMYVIDDNGKIEYVAASPDIVEIEMNKYFHDLNVLLNTELQFEEIFFYASMLHLVFVKIHPWLDGNGRTARLIEKWFLSHHLGKQCWCIQSEKYYYLNHQHYFANIRQLGIEYDHLNYSLTLPFLQMLPNALLLQS